MLKVLFFIVTILLPISLFSDVTIDNKDKVTYKLFIEKDNSAEHTAINANTKAVACLSDCKILIKKSKNKIDAIDGDTIIIKDGELTKELKDEKEKEKEGTIKEDTNLKKDGKDTLQKVDKIKEKK